MSQEENKLSDERLQETAAKLIEGYRRSDMHTDADFWEAMLSHRASAGGEGQPVGILVPDGEDGLEPIWYEGTEVAEGDELYLAAPSPSPAPVADDAETLLIYLRGSLSREDEDGMIDVPADYLTRSIALLALPKAVPDVSEEMVAQAMSDAWNDICTDTGYHPLDIDHGKGEVLFFAPDHWASMTAAYLCQSLSAAQGVE